VFLCNLNDSKAENWRRLNLKCFSICWPTQFAFAFSFPPTENWENRPVTQKTVTVPPLLLLFSVQLCFCSWDQTIYVSLVFLRFCVFWRREKPNVAENFPLGNGISFSLSCYWFSFVLWPPDAHKNKNGNENEIKKKKSKSLDGFPWRRSLKLGVLFSPTFPILLISSPWPVCCCLMFWEFRIISYVFSARKMIFYCWWSSGSRDTRLMCAHKI